ncbi:MAG: diguanylate cyclase [Candidatus Sericytochromatia bacterium]
MAGILDSLEFKLGYDYSLFYNRKTSIINDKIKIIGIDSKSIEKIGVFPWRRDLYTNILKKLEGQPKIISFDILFSDYSNYPEDDIKLAEQIKKNGNIILPISLEVDTQDKNKLSFFYPIEELSKNSKSNGLINYFSDNDGILRKTSLYRFDADNNKVNILSYEIARNYLDKININLPENLYCNFEGKDEIFETYSFYDVLTGRIDPYVFKDSIVLIGATAEGLQDRIASPIGPLYGIFYHAQLLSNILNNDYIKPVPKEINFILILMISISAYLIWRFFDTTNQVILIFCSTAIIYIIHILFFKYNIWLSIISFSIANITTFIALILFEQLVIARALKFELDTLIINYYKKNLKYRVYQTNINLISDEINKDKLSNTERVLELSKIGKNLAIERSFLETLLNNIKIPIIVTNQVGNVILTNPIAESFFIKDLMTKKTSELQEEDINEVEENFNFKLSTYNKNIKKEQLELKINANSKKEVLIGKKIFDIFEDLPTFKDELKKYYSSFERNVIEFEDEKGANIYKMRLFNLETEETKSYTICLMEDVTSWHQMANKDGLTSLWNQRYFKDYLKREIEKAKRYKNKLSLIMMDVDHFKKFNDTYGHQTGDIVLKSVSKVITDTVRVTDIPARYGGEEFAIILTMTDEEGAIKLANRLREKIEKLEIKDLNNNPVRKVTASLGVCFYEYGDVSDFIEYADNALYECKKAGRNTVISYSELVKKNKAIEGEVKESELKNFITEAISNQIKREYNVEKD